MVPPYSDRMSRYTAHIDKLYTQKTNLENELNTFLGIDNIGNVEKKERLIKDEANSNNDIINDYSDSIGSNLEEGFKSVEKVLGYKVTIEPTSSPAQAVDEKKDPKEDPKKGQEDNGINN